MTPRAFIRSGDIARAAEQDHARVRALPIWRTMAIGARFFVPDRPFKYVARQAAYYRTSHGLRFRCRKGTCEGKNGVWVERLDDLKL